MEKIHFGRDEKKAFPLFLCRRWGVQAGPHPMAEVVNFYGLTVSCTCASELSCLVGTRIPFFSGIVSMYPIYVYPRLWSQNDSGYGPYAKENKVSAFSETRFREAIPSIGMYTTAQQCKHF